MSTRMKVIGGTAAIIAAATFTTIEMYIRSVPGPSTAHRRNRRYALKRRLKRITHLPLSV